MNTSSCKDKKRVIIESFKKEEKLTNVLYSPQKRTKALQCQDGILSTSFSPLCRGSRYSCLHQVRQC